jgi:hypothetical protein
MFVNPYNNFTTRIARHKVAHKDMKTTLNSRSAKSMGLRCSRNRSFSEVRISGVSGRKRLALAGTDEIFYDEPGYLEGQPLDTEIQDQVIALEETLDAPAAAEHTITETEIPNNEIHLVWYTEDDGSSCLDAYVYAENDFAVAEAVMTVQADEQGFVGEISLAVADESSIDLSGECDVIVESIPVQVATEGDAVTALQQVLQEHSLDNLEVVWDNLLDDGTLASKPENTPIETTSEAPQNAADEVRVNARVAGLLEQLRQAEDPATIDLITSELRTLDTTTQMSRTPNKRIY